MGLERVVQALGVGEEEKAEERVGETTSEEQVEKAVMGGVHMGDSPYVAPMDVPSDLLRWKARKGSHQTTSRSSP